MLHTKNCNDWPCSSLEVIIVNGRMTVDATRQRRPIAIGNLSNTGDLKST